MKKDDLIYIAGHRGLVGSAIHRALEEQGYSNFLLRRSSELDLRDQAAVQQFFAAVKPDYVFLAAAHVGGIVANNTYRADFIYDNLMIQSNVIKAAYDSGVKKLLFLGSTCIYPRDCPQPMKEEYLLTGPLEPTNEPYAIAKIAGLKMCENFNRQYGTNFLSVMPTNLYGPHDNFDLETSHVLPALVRKMHLGRLLMAGDWDALRRDIADRPFGQLTESTSDEMVAALSKQGVRYDSSSGHVSVEVWGSGTPRREFLWSEDMAAACVFIMQELDVIDIRALMASEDQYTEHLNIGTGQEVSIRDLAELTRRIVGFSGDLHFNTHKPDGTPRKLTDVSRLHKLGWQHTVDLEEGLERMYGWYCSFWLMAVSYYPNSKS